MLIQLLLFVYFTIFISLDSLGKIKKTKFISKMSDYVCELFYFVFMTFKRIQRELR